MLRRRRRRRAFLVFHARLAFLYFVLPVASRCSPSPVNASAPCLSTLSTDPSHSSTEHDCQWMSSHITYVTALGVVVLLVFHSHLPSALRRVVTLNV
ncbi:hypothetical protein B0H10DRAFT_2138931 [Mycena sp. CBHHK59/15]|nr:hypothetical protein B0H10DRAFT_2138931 [Mycena sp. CBHHK59/15]